MTPEWLQIVVTVLGIHAVAKFGFSCFPAIGGVGSLAANMPVNRLQLFFHRFNVKLSSDWAATPPLSPIKRLTFAIQDAPALARREMAMLTVLAVIALAFAWR